MLISQRFIRYLNEVHVCRRDFFQMHENWRPPMGVQGIVLVGVWGGGVPSKASEFLKH